MSAYLKDIKKLTPSDLKEKKNKKEKISALTAYDYSMARLLDQTYIDFILVGDSASNIMAGHENTLPISLKEMIYHAKSVVKGVRKKLVIADLPFGSYQQSTKQALKSAISMVKKANVQAIKIEGGVSIIKKIEKIIQAGIPVMGHLGLMPQFIHHYKGYELQAKEEKQAEELIKEAKCLEQAGCFALVLEKVPALVAEKITKLLTIPIIGIGAGDKVDGQILVINDLLGMDETFHPKFIKQYLNLSSLIKGAVNEYTKEVILGVFPSKEHQY